MLKVNPKFHDDQYNHLIDCNSCRLLMATYDFHSISRKDQHLANDYFTKTLMDGYQSYLEGVYKWNNVPFVDETNAVNSSGGFVCAPGKGSHAFEDAKDEPGFVKMKANAGTRNGMIYSLMLFVSPCNAAKGEFFISFQQMYENSHLYLREFSANGGNSAVRRYWALMSKSIIRILRFYPQNIRPSEALNACEQRFNINIFRDGKIRFCSNCAEFKTCAVNAQVAEYLQGWIFKSKNLFI